MISKRALGYYYLETAKPYIILVNYDPRIFHVHFVYSV